MKAYRIVNTVSGADCGTYEADDVHGALRAMDKAAGMDPDVPCLDAEGVDMRASGPDCDDLRIEALDNAT